VRFIADKVALVQVPLRVGLYPVSIIPPVLYMYSDLYVTLNRRTNGKAWKPTKGQSSLAKSAGEGGTAKSTFTFFQSSKG
jgi:hypothetical protein